MVYNSVRCVECGLYCCAPGCPNEEVDTRLADFKHPDCHPSASARERRSSAPDGSEVQFQRCGGGRRIIKKRIGD